MVDAGFTADAAVNHGEERGGDLDEIKASFEGGGQEAGQIADYAATEGDYAIGAFGGEIEHFVVKVLQDGHLLAGFAGRDADEVRFEVLLGEAVEEHLGVDGLDIVVGDDDGMF